LLWDRIYRLAQIQAIKRQPRKANLLFAEGVDASLPFCRLLPAARNKIAAATLSSRSDSSPCLVPFKALEVAGSQPFPAQPRQNRLLRPLHAGLASQSRHK
jgi:hypothetical protein